jgi:hypothetical protein
MIGIMQISTEVENIFDYDSRARIILDLNQEFFFSIRKTYAPQRRSTGTRQNTYKLGLDISISTVIF